MVPSKRLRAFSLVFAFALFLGQGIGAATLGALVDSRGYGPTFVLAGVATGLLALTLAWLFGLNPSLNDRRPIDLIRAGRTEELMRAIRAERSDAFA